MRPQFFDMIGVRAQGTTFEVVFWVLIALIGAIVILREARAKRAMADAWYGYVIGAGLLVFGALYFFKALVQQELYFGEEGLQVSNYGLAIALGFVAGIYLAIREAGRGPDPPTVGQVFDLAFWILIFGMVGARVLFIIVSWKDYYNLCAAPELVDGSGGVQDCFAILKFWKGGLVFFGGFIGAAAAAAVYCFKHQVNFLRAADVLIPSLAIGHFFGRLGCVSAGCCYGNVSDVPWSIAFPQGSAAYVQHLTDGVATRTELFDLGHSLFVHPTQLYEASAELLFFTFLILLRPRKRFHGQVIAAWLILYSLLRFVVEFLRGDTLRGFVFELPIPFLNGVLGLPDAEPTILSTSQCIGLALLTAGILIWVTQRKKGLIAESG